MSDREVIELGRPEVADLEAIVEALGRWQRGDLALQLHPGDLGWFWRFGPGTTASATRTWTRDGELVAVGLLDGPVLRVALAPGARQDHELAHQLGDDLGGPERGVLGEGEGFVEAPHDALLHECLTGAGWPVDAPWTPLRRDLVAPVHDPGARVEVVGPEEAEEVAVVLRGSFDRSTFSAERWRVMACGPAYDDARCLLVRDQDGVPAATVTVWSAALRELGSSSADVCTMSANVGGIAAYESAGFVRLPERLDRKRPA